MENLFKIINKLNTSTAIASIFVFWLMTIKAIFTTKHDSVTSFTS